MNVDEARESLAFSEYARKRARDDMSRPWLALVLLASLSVVSLSFTEDAASLLGLFWALLAVTAAIIGFDLSPQQSTALLFGLYGFTLLAVGFSLRVGRKLL